MQKAGPRKTKSALSLPAWWRLAFVGLATLVVIVTVTITGHRSGAVTLRLPRGTYHLETATTAAEQEKGLGGRAGMPASQGMLFIFANQADQCFWMKDMHFPLDIIWTDSAKRVTHIEHGLSPATYPQQYCAAGQYVIELNAGTVAKNGVRTGQKLDF